MDLQITPALLQHTQRVDFVSQCDSVFKLLLHPSLRYTFDCHRDSLAVARCGISVAGSNQREIAFAKQSVRQVDVILERTRG